jgi:23S rRNA (adenine2503-C2)-methyltransferase
VFIRGHLWFLLRMLSDFAGMTLADFAASRDTSAAAVRDEYARMMRNGAGFTLPTPTRRQSEDSVIKFCLDAGASASGTAFETESVVIPMNSYRAASWNTLCVSSQVGCRMGCTFCETARLGLLRNLTAAEIVTQFLVARDLVSPAPRGGIRDEAWRSYHYRQRGIQNIVFMGMGEPLDNFDEVVQAIRVLSDPNGLAFPHKQITISTVGRIDGIRRLAALNWPNLRLAISLSAPNDALRDQLVPINKAMPLAELRRALLEYPLARRGLFLIEYVLIGDVNDTPEHARQIAEWCRDLRCVVNLIPYNPQRDAAYATPTEATTLRFMHDLRAQGIFVKRRLPRGRDLMGACGQLGNPALLRAVPARPAHVGEH